MPLHCICGRVVKLRLLQVTRPPVEQHQSKTANGKAMTIQIVSKYTHTNPHTETKADSPDFQTAPPRITGVGRKVHLQHH